MSLRTTWLLLLMAAAGPLSMGQREPVLKQIDLPHPYYYREMYLPQLTTGPSGVAWCPSRTTGRKCGIRLPARLFAGWAMGSLCLVLQRCYRSLHSGCSDRAIATVN